MGGTVAREGSSGVSVPTSKLDAKIIEAVHRRGIKGSSMLSLNSIFLKFPRIDESFRKLRITFQQFDEDGNGSIDLQELKHCFSRLEINFTEDEINELFETCDINADMSMNFNEFIVLLCLVYLLKEDTSFQHDKSSPELMNPGSTFETIVDAFVFLDKDKDGHVSKNEMFDAIYENDSGFDHQGR